MKKLSLLLITASAFSVDYKSIAPQAVFAAGAGYLAYCLSRQPISKQPIVPVQKELNCQEVFEIFNLLAEEKKTEKNSALEAAKFYELTDARYPGFSLSFTRHRTYDVYFNDIPLKNNGMSWIFTDHTQRSFNLREISQKYNETMVKNSEYMNRELAINGRCELKNDSYPGFLFIISNNDKRSFNYNKQRLHTDGCGRYYVVGGPDDNQNISCKIATYSNQSVLSKSSSNQSVLYKSWLIGLGVSAGAWFAYPYLFNFSKNILSNYFTR